MADSHHRKAMAPPADMAYRTPAVLPFELIQHVGIFFEENLYTQGLNLLYSTLSSGTYASQKVFVPLPQHIALAVTFLVHPSTTTRAKSPEAKEAAPMALRLLRLLSTLVNPHDCSLNHAFVFTQQTLRSGRSHHTEDDDRGLQSSGGKPLNLEMGQGDSLWARAEDFWHAVGWAFNCSVLHPERWERWRVWLHYMCEIMEDDWDQRMEKYQEFGAHKREDARTLEEAKKGNGAAGGSRKKTDAGPAEKTKVKAKGTRKSAHDTEAEEPKGRARRAWQNADLNQNPGKAARKVDEGLSILRESLIFQFIAASSDNGRNRRILRAIFADGSTTSINEFRQVFRKELKAQRAPDKTKKREREVNVDKEQYGDYMSQEETDDEVNGACDSTPKPIRRSKRTRRGTRTVPNGSSAQADTGSTSLPRQDVGLSSMGGLASLRLRKRLLGILSDVSSRLPQDFISILDLYNLFSDNIGPQPLPIFQAFVSPSILPQEFADDEQTTLCEVLLYSLLEASAPSTDEVYLDQSKLEKCFLPYAAAASSVVSNVKVSILLEAAIVVLGKRNRLTVTDSFIYAVEAGIDRRVNKASAELQRSLISEDQSPEWSWLVESCNRLTFLTKLLSPTA